MINGIGGHIEMWGSLADELARSRRLVLFDAPGAGASLPRTRWSRMPGLAAVVVAIMDALDIPVADVLGYSWGGTLAQQLAHDHPDRVGRLILASTLPGLGSIPPSIPAACAMLGPGRYRTEHGGRDLAARIYGGDYRSSQGSASRTLPAYWHARPPSRRGYAQQLYAIAGWSSLPWLHRLAQDTLVIGGTDDPLVHTLNSRLLARLIPRCELHLAPEGGHLWLLDHSRDSAAVIERFLHQKAAQPST
jgi:pimeloyl-ACP methyl ester carboxylesterase